MAQYPVLMTYSPHLNWGQRRPLPGTVYLDLSLPTSVLAVLSCKGQEQETGGVAPLLECWPTMHKALEW